MGTGYALLVLGLSIQIACGTGEESSGKAGPATTGPAVPRAARIVSLSPLATRFLIELGVGHRLVGVDRKSSVARGVANLPIVELSSAGDLAPDLVLIPTLADADGLALRRLEAAGAQLVEFAPHDLEDVFALCRGLGAQLVGAASATLFERRIARPLALVGGASSSPNPPRVVAVVGFEPLELAGGHSFETDLIEIAGGTSVTHGGEASRRLMTAEHWAEFAPDLVLVTTSEAPTLVEKANARALIPDGFRVEFFDFDRETFWLNKPEEDAERLRVLVESVRAEQ